MDVDYVQLASVQEEQSAERTGDTREPHQMLCITILALLALFPSILASWTHIHLSALRFPLAQVP